MYCFMDYMNTASKETSQYTTCRKAFIYSALPKHMEASRWEKGKKIKQTRTSSAFIQPQLQLAACCLKQLVDTFKLNTTTLLSSRLRDCLR